MNYTLRKLNCKALIIAIFSIVFMVLFSTRAYAAYSMRLCPNFLFDNKAVYVAENVSPRASSLTSVTVGYDNLSDLVYYCNEHGLSTTLAYNTALGVYVGYVNDDVVDAKTFGVSSLHGLLGNSAGKVYVAEKKASGGNTTINNNTYNYNHTVINPSSPGYTRTPTSNTAPSYWEVIDTLKAVYTKVDFAVQYLSLVCDWLDFQAGLLIDVVHSLERSVAPALEAVNNNLISFKDSTVTGLKNLDNDVVFGINVLLEQLNVQNRIYSGVTGLGSRLDTLVTNSAGIGSRLDSIISNGAVQVNTSPIEARLDKLISMYRKVNSVVLDTASISSGSVSSGSIRSAVGGELEDAVFWGMSGYNSANSFAYADPLTYVLNDVENPVIDRPLRGIQLGTSIPDSLNSSDSVLMAGVWKLASGQYEISDTYNAATGEYVQRLYTQSYNGTENWNMAVKSDGMNLFYLSDYAFEYLEANRYSMSGWSQFKYRPYAYAFNADKNAAAAYKNTYTIWGRNIRFVVDAAEYPDVATWKTRLSNMAAAGTPLEIWWVPSVSGKTYSDGPIVETLDRITVAIPEGNSSIFGNRVRITGKYETYDSYTQTADIIAAINNIPPYDDSGLIAAITGMTTPTVTTDLTEVISRLDLILGELQSTSGSASCEHTYAQHMEQEADCTLPGLMISTCSKCGDSYSEIVDPLGHDWVVSSHVDAVTDPDTGEETASAYDVYTCSRCDRTYEDHTGDGAPDEDYSSTSISKLVVQVFSKLGTFAGKLIGFFVHLLDKALTSVDNVISKFNDYTAQITGFGGSYTTWLTGLWGIIPAELQIALTFSVICMALGAVGKKLLFS